MKTLRLLPFVARRARWRRSPPYDGFTQPFNGQQVRLGLIERMKSQFEPDSCIETGTFLGTTTRYLATWGVPVVSVDISPEWHRLAARSLRDQPTVTLICADSRDALSLISERESFSRPFIYLDAHALQGDPDDLLEVHPLAHELKTIFSSWNDAFIVIDDFLVPGQPGYGYDIVEGVPLSSDLLDLPPDVSLAFPAAPPTKETGARRGSAFLAHGNDARRDLDRLVQAGELTPS